MSMHTTVAFSSLHRKALGRRGSRALLHMPMYTDPNAAGCCPGWPGPEASCSCVQGTWDIGCPCCMQGIREMGFAGLGVPKDLEQWRQRVQWVAEHIRPSPVPNLAHDALMAGLETWLAPHLMGCRSKAQLQSLNWNVILRSAWAAQAYVTEFKYV